METQILHFEDPTPTTAPGAGVRAHWYRPLRRRDIPRAVVVLPIQGGDYEVSRHFADAFAGAGFDVLRFERRAEWLDPQAEIESVGALIPAYVRDIRLGIAKWRELLADAHGATIDVGLFGVSMGAMMGTLILAEEPDIRRAVLCIGGGNLADILVDGRDKELDAWRAIVTERVGGAAAFRERVGEVVGPTDVLDAAPRVGAERIHFVAARFDRVVPWVASVRLWTALGRPKRTVLPCGHYSAAVFVPWIRRAAIRWLS